MTKSIWLAGCTLLGLMLCEPAAMAAEASVQSPVTEVTATPDGEPPKSCCTLPSRWAALPVATRLSIEESEAGARVLVDGELFAEYVTDAGSQPVVWPIRSASGHAMTRSWPLGPAKPTEKDDHPHHQSLWFSHGGVNGFDFWHVPRDAEPGDPRIVHKEFVRQQVDAGDTVVIETNNDWVAAGEKVLADNRTLRFGVLDMEPGDGAARYLDFTITLHAAYGPVSFADTKEGSFGVRVPGPMKLDAGLGGRVLNDRGQTDADAWGRSASWVAYQGPLGITPEGEASPPGGVVMMSHPESFRPQCRWHVRGYGLFAANPFGIRDFPKESGLPGGVTLEPDEELSLRYRVVFYEGEAGPARFAGWHENFSLQ